VTVVTVVTLTCLHTRVHIRFTTLWTLFVQDYPGEPLSEPVWILLKQETMTDSGISWTICKSAPLPQTNNHASTPLLNFYRPDALPAAQRTALYCINDNVHFNVSVMSPEVQMSRLSLISKFERIVSVLSRLVRPMFWFLLDLGRGGS